MVVEHCQDAVWRVVAPLLEDRLATEDLVHRTFIRAYERLDAYALGTDIQAWLVTMARNLARNHLRDRSREQRRVTLYQESLSAASEPDASWHSTQELLRRSLEECRDQLDDVAQEALRLFYAEDLSIALVATRLGRSEGATQKLLSRIRIALRACLARKQGAS
jgi:RNA polymerase sigma-70 factor (ECF subfamily)